MAVIHISESEAVRDFASVLAHIRAASLLKATGTNG